MQKATTLKLPEQTESNAIRTLKRILKNRFLYLLILPAVVVVFIFSYLPYPYLRMAFQDYNIYVPANSEWVGLEHFIKIVSNKRMMGSIINTLTLSVLSIIFAFPLPIILALSLNELRNAVFKKIVQSISYLPHFLSWITVVGIAYSIYAMSGLVNDIAVAFGSERTMFLSLQNFFVPDALILSIWKSTGWNSVIYLAAIAGVDTSLYEAAALDGANRFQQAIHVTLPSILPTVSIMLIWALGSVMGSNFELVYGLQNDYIDFEVISTVIYKQGLKNGDYGPVTALGLFQGVVNVLLLVGANGLVKKLTKVGLF